MSRLRVAFGAMLGAAAMLLTTLCLPAAAAASGSSILVYSAGPTKGNPAVLTVVAGDFNVIKLTSLTVHLYSGSTDVYDVTDMAYASGPAGDETWTAAAPIPQADLAPGTYTMTVDAGDSAEADTGLAAPDPLAFVYATTITAKAAPASISYNKTTVTISGRLTGITPGSGSSAPVGLGGIPVELNDLYLADGVTQIATTQADGTYTAQVQLPSSRGQYDVQVENGPTVGGAAAPLPLTLISDPTRVSASVSPKDFKYGGTADATLSGTAEYKSGATWLPLANYPVQVEAGVTSDYVTTNAEGKFTWTFPPSDGTAWSVLVDGGLLDQSQVDGSIHVAVPLTSKWFVASLTPFARLNVSGCVRVTAPGFFGPHGHMNIQYSTGPRGPWKYLGRVSLTLAGSQSCDGNQQSYFKGSVPVRLAGAYYRANFPATPDYQAKASRALFRWHYVTRITSLKVSPGRVHKGGKLSVSGRLQQYKARWLAYPKRRVLIIFRPKGTTTWYYIRKVTTSASGHFSATFVDPASATWSAEYEGDKTHFASGGVTRYVPVSNAQAISAAIGWQSLSPQGLNPDRLRAAASLIGIR